ncbi:MAG: D-serine ammonia-lyase [Tissierellia bacterium]|nr:D-serine ammonia-lyase [Tissierellia bacterium]
MNLPTELIRREPFLWINPSLEIDIDLDTADMEQAKNDWEAFGPLIAELFDGAEIDSALTPLLGFFSDSDAISFLKQDNRLPVAGSIKARGGFFEVLSHARELALQEDLIKPGQPLVALASQQTFFTNYRLDVASTGNLGLSIGLMGRAIGFSVYVHMSADAKQWKKDLLQSRGARVVEYDGDYSLAVTKARAASLAEPRSYFVDDERSLRLFWGYSKAAYDLIRQLPDDITPERPLFVAIPCGVGGAPGGIAYGLKALLGKSAHIFFAEPVESPSVLLGMASGKRDDIKVQDIGLTGKTLADGLAVGRPSGYVCRQMDRVLSGIFTVTDQSLLAMQYRLYREEGIKCEPSACAGLFLPHFIRTEPGQQYLQRHSIKPLNIRYVFWATGGALIPEEKYQDQLAEGKVFLEQQPNMLD